VAPAPQEHTDHEKLVVLADIERGKRGIIVPLKVMAVKLNTQISRRLRPKGLVQPATVEVGNRGRERNDLRNRGRVKHLEKDSDFAEILGSSHSALQTASRAKGAMLGRRGERTAR
jgi:hypothetical protein